VTVSAPVTLPQPLLVTLIVFVPADAKEALAVDPPLNTEPSGEAVHDHVPIDAQLLVIAV
jgi:hypothetical protein